ncbi:MAG TPA: hypothetical protein VF594_12490, partial [Rubricoccaceae bacterium]
MDRLALAAFGTLTLSACSGTPVAPAAPTTAPVAASAPVAAAPEMLHINHRSDWDVSWVIGANPDSTAGETLTVDDAL